MYHVSELVYQKCLNYPCAYTFNLSIKVSCSGDTPSCCVCRDEIIPDAVRTLDRDIAWCRNRARLRRAPPPSAVGRPHPPSTPPPSVVGRAPPSPPRDTMSRFLMSPDRAGDAPSFKRMRRAYIDRSNRVVVDRVEFEVDGAL